MIRPASRRLAEVNEARRLVGRVHAPRDICRALEARFRAGEYAVGCAEAVDEIGALIAEHFPKTADNPDELPNRPVIL